MQHCCSNNCVGCLGVRPGPFVHHLLDVHSEARAAQLLSPHRHCHGSASSGVSQPRTVLPTSIGFRRAKPQLQGHGKDVALVLLHKLPQWVEPEDRQGEQSQVPELLDDAAHLVEVHGLPVLLDHKLHGRLVVLQVRDSAVLPQDHHLHCLRLRLLRGHAGFQTLQPDRGEALQQCRSEGQGEVLWALGFGLLPDRRGLEHVRHHGQHALRLTEKDVPGLEPADVVLVFVAQHQLRHGVAQLHDLCTL